MSDGKTGLRTNVLPICWQIEQMILHEAQKHPIGRLTPLPEGRVLESTYKGSDIYKRLLNPRAR